VAVQLALSLDATPPGTYRQRGTSSLQRLFRAHFPELVARYESEFATQLGKFRLERITKAVQRFLACGDYRRGIARIKCTNPDCGLEYFRPFSCKVFHLCPSCSQKRTLLFGEYVNEQLLLRLPHRQIVFTFPKVLRGFFRHDRGLYGETSKLVYRMIQRFYSSAAGYRIRSAAVIAYSSAGDFVRFNPHLHAIFLEGGFDRQGRFVHVPALNLARLAQYFRASMVAFFLKRSLINERLGRNMLQWTHSGFSLDMSVRIPANSSKTREALAQYIARPPVSLSKMLVEEHEASVLYRSEYNPYFKTNNRLFPALEFLVQLLQHLPDARTQLIRRYGLYSSRSRGTWSRMPYLVRLAPEGWIRQHEQHPAGRLDGTPESCPDQSVSAKVSRAAWARLLAKIYEVDALKCSRCGSPMKVLALITDPHEVRRILLHLIKTGLAPPGLEAASLS
jgi:hypothetical protein